MSATPALMAAAAGVAVGHAILPDHWVPLAVVGRTENYPLAQVARLSALAGIAHVLVSLLLGAIIIAVGLQFRSVVEGAQNTVIGIVLVLTGLAFAVLELTGRGHSHDDDHSHRRGHTHSNGPRREAHAHEHRHVGGDRHGGESLDENEHEQPRAHPAADRDRAVAAGEGRKRRLTAIMVPFGAAASPDLTILPVFLAATAAGVFAAIGALVVFSAVTIGSIVGLTLLACFGGYQVHGQWLDRWGNTFTALVLVTIGVLVFTSVI